MSRYCEQCGAKLEAGENFCPSCGEKVIVDEINPNQSSPKPAPTTPNKNSMMIFGVVLTFVLLIGAGWHFYNKYSNESLGGIYLGMSKADVEKKFGYGSYTDWGYFYNDVYVQFTNDFNAKVNYLYCGSYNVKISTNRDIHIGSTLEDIEKAYGKNYFRSDWGGDITIRYEFKNFHIFFHLNAYTYRVMSINIYSI